MTEVIIPNTAIIAGTKRDYHHAKTASAVGNPYLFTARRFDPESGNYYYRARVYSPDLGRFLSLDPLGFDSGDYNLYRYALNNPTNLTDPTGEFPILAWLVKAGIEAAVDGLMQATINYYFDPNVSTVEQAFQSIDLRQVGIAFVTGLLPGSNVFQSVAGAAGDVLLNYLGALENCEEYTPEQALEDFSKSFLIEIIGSLLGDMVAEFGPDIVAAGLRKAGYDDIAEKVLRQADKVTDDIVPLPSTRTGITRDVSSSRINEFWRKRVTESDAAGSWGASWDMFAMSGNVIGYEVDGIIAGALAFARRQSDDLPQPALYVMAIEVLEGHRKSGVGRALMQAAQSESIQQGLGGNLWAVVNKFSQPNWQDTVAAMRRLGFEVISDGESITLFFSP